MTAYRGPRKLRALGPDIWVVDQAQRYFGLEVGCRMTVVRLADGALWVHSAITLDDELRSQLDALGPVRYVVAPNRVHYLRAGDTVKAYPGSRLWIAPGVEKKRPELAFGTFLTDDAPPEWSASLAQAHFRGRPFENEFVFCHGASRTLIMCDLAFNFSARFPLATRMFTWVIGGYGEFRPSRLDPLLIRDRRASRESLEKILSWDFDTVVVAHGEVLEHDGREALRRGYRWLLEGPV